MDRWAERCVQLAPIGCWVAGSVGHLQLTLWLTGSRTQHQTAPSNRSKLYALTWSILPSFVGKILYEEFPMNVNVSLCQRGSDAHSTFWQQSFRDIFKETFQLPFKVNAVGSLRAHKSAIQLWMRPYYVELSYYISSKIKVDFFDEIAQLCANTSLLPLAINTFLVFRKNSWPRIEFRCLFSSSATNWFFKFM